MMSTKALQYGLVILLSVHFCALMPIQSLQRRNTDTSTMATTQSPSSTTLSPESATSISTSTTSTEASTTSTAETDQADETAQAGPFQPANGCECRRKDDSQSCQSLENAIYEFYYREDKYDIPYHFFSLKELFYAALFDGKNNIDLLPTPLQGVDFDTDYERGITTSNCWYHMNNYKPIATNTSSCRWVYECTQNRLQFPSFTVEAVLTNDSSTESCSPVTMKNKRFQRTSCSHDPSLPHWLECDCEDLVVGYQ